METTTIQQILADIATAKKNKRWLSCTYRINTDKGVFSMGVKAYGWWVQRMQICEVCDGIPEQKTKKAFDAAFVSLVNSIVAGL